MRSNWCFGSDGSANGEEEPAVEGDVDDVEGSVEHGDEECRRRARRGEPEQLDGPIEALTHLIPRRTGRRPALTGLQRLCAISLRAVALSALRYARASPSAQRYAHGCREAEANASCQVSECNDYVSFCAMYG